MGLLEGILVDGPGHGAEVGKGTRDDLRTRDGGYRDSQGPGGTLTSMGFFHSSSRLGAAASAPGFG